MTPFAPHFGQGAPSFSAPVPSQCGQVSSRSSVAITMNIPPFLIFGPSPVTFHGHHLLNDTKKPHPSKDEVFAVPPLLTAEKPFSQKVQKQHGFNTPFLITGKESRHRLLSFKRSNSEAHSASDGDRFTAATDSLNPARRCVLTLPQHCSSVLLF